MTGSEHYAEAERLASKRVEDAKTTELELREATVHALLALTAATTAAANRDVVKRWTEAAG